MGKPESFTPTFKERMKATPRTTVNILGKDIPQWLLIDRFEGIDDYSSVHPALSKSEVISFSNKSAGIKVARRPLIPQFQEASPAVTFEEAAREAALLPDLEWTGTDIILAMLPYPRGWVGVKDTKSDETGAVLIFTPAEWAAFIGGVKDGEFDL
jgi:hypothetical protein